MAGLSCGMKCLKYLLFAFNFIIWVCGIAVLGVGIYSRIKLGNFDSLLDDSTIPSAANLFIASGVFVMVIGFLGCCGAWKENKCLLISYAVALILIFVLEIAAGIYAYVKIDDVKESLKKGLDKAVKTTYNTGTTADDAVRKAVDWFQENVECCGSATPDDWKTSAWNVSDTTTRVFPDSCCKKITEGCAKNPNVDHWTKGCYEQGEKYVKDHMAEIGGVGVGIAFIQLLGIVFAILLCRSLDYEKV